MITRTWKNHPIIPQSKNLSNSPFQPFFSSDGQKWVNDFENELLENNRIVFSKIDNTDAEEHWLKSDDD